MDEIHFYCVICGERLRVLPENAGGFCDCPRCLRAIPIPGFPARPGQPVESGAVFSPRILGIDLKFLCEGCGSKIQVDARRQDTTLDCPVCHEPTLVPAWGGALPPTPRGVTAPAVRLSDEECEFLSAPMRNGGQALLPAGTQ